MQPPEGQGVYAIANYELEMVYIGSSNELWACSRNWKDKIKNQHPDAEKFTSLCSDHTKWKFMVVRGTHGLTFSGLRTLEAEIIREAVEKGVRVINKNAPAPTSLHTLDGLTGTVTYHATRYGLLGHTVAYRMAQGMSLREAIDTPKLHNASRIKMMAVLIIGVQGKHISVSEAAKYLGESAGTLRKRLKRLRDKDPSMVGISVLRLARRAR